MLRHQNSCPERQHLLQFMKTNDKDHLGYANLHCCSALLDLHRLGEGHVLCQSSQHTLRSTTSVTNRKTIKWSRSVSRP